MPMCCPNQEKVSPNPSTLPVTTSARSYPPSLSLLAGSALCCSIIPPSVIKGSQGEPRWSLSAEELRIGVHISHRRADSKDLSPFMA